jgi:hypothetical protein
VRIDLKLIVCVILSLLFIGLPNNANAVTNKDQALALATSGCYQGLFKFLVPSNLLAFSITSTALSSQLSDETNSEFVQNHHNQISESWNSAAALDSRWTKLISTYDNIYSYIGITLRTGPNAFEIRNSAERKYGGAITSLCKIAISNSTAKAKSKKISLKQWVIRNAGDLLPPLDPLE